jgi:signal transduction histidine kinase/CheY-like chemotaxis protein
LSVALDLIDSARGTGRNGFRHVIGHPAPYLRPFSGTMSQALPPIAISARAGAPSAHATAPSQHHTPLIQRGAPLRYAMGLGATLLIFFVVSWLAPFVMQHVPFAPFLALVIAVAYLAGPGPALAATVLGTLLVGWNITASGRSSFESTLDVRVRLAFFVALGTFISWISERWRRANVELRDREQKLRILLEKMPVVLWSTDEDLVLTSSSAAMSYLFPASGPQPEPELFLKEDPRSLAVTAQRRAVAGEAVSYDLASGERHFHVHVEPLRDADGRIAGSFGMAWDVTAQHRAEEQVLRANQELEARVAKRTDELAQANLVLMQQIAERHRAEADRGRAEEELRKVTRHARCMLWHAEIVRDENAQRDFPGFAPLRWGLRLYDEQATRQMLSLDASLSGRALRTAWRDRIPAEDRRAMDQTSDAAILGNQPGYTQEFRCVDEADRVQWLLENVSVQPRGDGRWYAVGVVTDITARKIAEAQRDAQRDQVLAERAARAEAEAANRMKDQFLAMLSHELRTPMAPVLMTVSQMAGDDRVPDEIRSVLRMVRRNVELEARLIDDLLDLTRISRGKLDLDLRETDVHSLLYHAWDVCRADAAAKNLRVQLTASAPRCFVRGDATRLQQVLWNLVRNAVKFTPDGGAITIRSSNDDRQRIVIEVIDTGIGIDPGLLPRIFKAFEQGGHDVTRNYGGLGLGLAISKALIDLHGGTLAAHSDGPGAGAAFTVTLDTVDAPVIAVPSHPPAPASDGQPPLRILLVEDHADTRKATARLLRLLGHDVATADCVAAGLEAAESRAEAANAAGGEQSNPLRPFDLIISDLGLPDGSGHDLMRQLKRRFGHAGLRGIALSGYGMDSDLRTSTESGFDAHLVKPVPLEQLEAAVRQVAGHAVAAR